MGGRRGERGWGVRARPEGAVDGTESGSDLPPLGPYEPGQPVEGGLQRGLARLALAHAGLPPEVLDLQQPTVAVELGVEPSHQALAFQDRQHVVAVPALELGDEGLEAVIEVEQAKGALAVAEDGVEGREKADARRRRRQ